jgi:nucleoid DNA-binding protein
MKANDDIIIKKFIKNSETKNMNSIAAEFYYNFFDEFKNFISTKKTVQIRGLGTFQKVKYKSREANNFKDNSRIIVEGKNKIKFVPSVSLKNKLNKKVVNE